MNMSAAFKNNGKSLLWWCGHILIAIAVTLTWAFFTGTAAGNRYEFLIHDVLVSLRGPRPAPDDVLIVALDEASYDAWELPMDRPIPRSKYAQLIHRLKELGAQRVVFDVVFAGHSASLENDNALAESLEALPTVLGVDYGVSEINGQRAYEVIRPDPFLAGPAAGLSLVSMWLDEGYARRFYVERGPQISDLTTLSEAGAGIFNVEDSKSRSMPGIHDLVNYYGGAGTVRTVSMYQVLEDVLPPKQLFQNKAVYVGLALRTGLGADKKDRFMTPFGEIFGVEIHATQAANIINNDWLRRAEPSTERWIGGVLVFLACLLVMILRPIHALVATIVLAAVWVGGSYTALCMNYFLTGGSGVLAAVPLVYLVNTTYNYLATLRSQREIERAFAHYLSPEIIDELKRNPDLLKLGGEEVLATAMFTDIKGFTTISETLGAKQVTQMLNAYFTDVSKAVMDEGGTVIKFIGDAVFALWGAPVPFEDHAARACRAALSIQKAVDDFNKSGRFPALQTRVGLNTGVMMVGNLGSDKRFDYTAIGDSVNLAARIEGVNKYLGTTVLVTEDTLNLASGPDGLLTMGAIRVVGKEEPVIIYRLSVDDVDPKMRAEWEHALSLWRERKWGEARDAFTNIGDTYMELKTAAQTYLESVSVFEQEEPPALWRGELIMDHK